MLKTVRRMVIAAIAASAIWLLTAVNASTQETAASRAEQILLHGLQYSNFSASVYVSTLLMPSNSRSPLSEEEFTLLRINGAVQGIGDALSLDWDELRSNNLLRLLPRSVEGTFGRHSDWAGLPESIKPPSRPVEVNKIERALLLYNKMRSGLLPSRWVPEMGGEIWVRIEMNSVPEGAILFIGQQRTQARTASIQYMRRDDIKKGRLVLTGYDPCPLMSAIRNGERPKQQQEISYLDSLRVEVTCYFVASAR